MTKLCFLYAHSYTIVIWYSIVWFGIDKMIAKDGTSITKATITLVIFKPRIIYVY